MMGQFQPQPNGRLPTNKKMQKLINTLSIISFTAFIAGIGGLGYGYLNKDKIMNGILDKVKGEIPSLVKGSMPSLPTETGLPSIPRF